jgi:hypothetical protein
MLEFGHIGLTVLMVALILLGYHQTLKKNIDDKKERNRRFFTLSGGLALWFTYLIILSISGVLQDMSLPPKFPLLLFIPFVIFTIIFYIRNKDSKFIQSIPNSWTIYYQTFRIIVEMLLLYTFYKGIIPEQATFEGLNFDVIMGITAPFMAYFVFGDKVKNLALARGWNILGILMVLFVAFIIGTSFYLPHIWGSETELTQPEFLTMPYLLIAGFLAPSAIFMHVVSLVQLRK